MKVSVRGPSYEVTRLSLTTCPELGTRLDFILHTGPGTSIRNSSGHSQQLISRRGADTRKRKSDG